MEFFEEGAFVDFFQEAGAQGVGYFEDGAQDAVGQGFEVHWMFVGGRGRNSLPRMDTDELDERVYRCLSVATGLVRWVHAAS